MPKSKKPPVKAAEGKPAAVKPGVSGKASPALRQVSSLSKPVSSLSKPVSPSGKPASPAGKAVVSAGKAATKASAPAMKPVLGKNGGRRVLQKAAPPKAVATKAAKVVEPPQPAEPRKWPKGGPTKPELKRYRDRLLEMRRTLLTSSKELAAEALKSSGQDFSVDHMADGGSDKYEQDFSLKLLEGESEQLADIREALMKIDGKVETPFGICEACADEDQRRCETCPWIPPSRLEVLPHARLCVQTKEIEERRKA